MNLLPRPARLLAIIRFARVALLAFGLATLSTFGAFQASLQIDGSGNFVLRWPGAAGIHYRIESSPDLSTWTSLPADPIGADAELSLVVAPAGAPAAPRLFWRVSATTGNPATATIVRYHSRPEVIDNWPYGSPTIVRDNHGSGQLLYLSFVGGQLKLFRSADLMATATAVPQSGTVSNGGPGPISMAQDSEGNLHVFHTDGWSGVVSKITLTRTKGVVTSWSKSTAINVPGNYGVSDYRFECRRGATQGGAETIVYLATAAADSHACAIMLFRSGLNRTSTADFVKLSDGTPGFDLLYTEKTVSDTPHSYGGHFAQVGSTADIVCAFGPLNVGHGGYEQHHCYTRVLTPNGPNTWSIGALVDRGSNNGVSRQYLYCCYSTADHAWLMWQDTEHGVRFDTYSSARVYTVRAVPEPDTRANYNGIGAFSVSPTGQIFASYILFDNQMNSQGVYWAYYSGTAWTTTFDFMQADFQGVHGSVGWDGGLAAIYVPDPPDQQYIGAIYTAAP